MLCNFYQLLAIIRVILMTRTFFQTKCSSSQFVPCSLPEVIAQGGMKVRFLNNVSKRTVGAPTIEHLYRGSVEHFALPTRDLCRLTWFPGVCEPRSALCYQCAEFLAGKQNLVADRVSSLMSSTIRTHYPHGYTWSHVMLAC